MASNSRKMYCPGCLRTLRVTSKDVCIICGYCDMPYIFAPCDHASQQLQEPGGEVEHDAAR